MIYRVIVEPTAEREIRAAVRWMTENVSSIVAARWYNGLYSGKSIPCAVIRPVAH